MRRPHGEQLFEYFQQNFSHKSRFCQVMQQSSASFPENGILRNLAEEC